MNTTVVVTVKNEANNIIKLLDSLFQQTITPSEIVIVDAGSTDQTTSKIISWHLKHSNIKLNLLIKPGINRSQGRNLGIQKSNSTTIAVTDAGCVAKPNWLESLTLPIREKRSQAVAGFYETLPLSLFQKCVNPFLAVTKDRFNPNTFLPSSRSIAFTKTAWIKAGKYPEDLNYCEDLIFARNLKKSTNLTLVPEALVIWSLPTNLYQYFKQINNYSLGDLHAGYKPHVIKIVSIILRYLVFIFLPIIFPIYLLATLFKFKGYIINIQSIFYILSIRITTDLSILYSVVKFLLIY